MRRLYKENTKNTIIATLTSIRIPLFPVYKYFMNEPLNEISHYNVYIRSH